MYRVAITIFLTVILFTVSFEKTLERSRKTTAFSDIKTVKEKKFVNNIAVSRKIQKGTKFGVPYKKYSHTYKSNDDFDFDTILNLK